MAASPVVVLFREARNTGKFHTVVVLVGAVNETDFLLGTRPQ